MLPSQVVHIDKKTLLPTEVSILNENKEEQIHIKFNQVSLGKTHAAGEYKIEQEDYADDGKKQQHQKMEKQVSIETSAEIDNAEFKTHYPLIKWENVHNIDEKVLKDGEDKRVILTYSGDKEFTIIQQLSEPSITPTIPVFAPGDPIDLGFAIGAITEQSISWEQDGMSFFLATSSLSKEEMIEVAASMAVEGMK